MPKPRKGDSVRCMRFNWILSCRNGTWYADGRSNVPNAGRHSLGTRDRQEALDRLPQLDAKRAADLGLVARSEISHCEARPLPLSEGRALYEQHIGRSRATGGVKPTTRKRYRTVFDKFIKFSRGQHIEVWDAVTGNVLTRYASHLEERGYAQKSLLNELTVLKQAVKWLIEENHLVNKEPIRLKLRRAESMPAYCYRDIEVAAMIEHCRRNDSTHWLGDIITALACTGMRVSELASLRWSDMDSEFMQITLRDETGSSKALPQHRRTLKSGRNRSFPIHPDLGKVLRRLPRTGAYVFQGPRGGRLNPNTLRAIFVREVIEPLASEFPSPPGGQGFKDGRLHSFRHYFCSKCSNNGVAERVTMDWLGHADSSMISTYYHLHDTEARRQMEALDFLGGARGRSDGDSEKKQDRGAESTESRESDRSKEAD